MKVGYARVSSKGQDLATQIDVLKSEGCEIIYQEKITGTIKNRPELNKLLQSLKKHDTLVVTKLDRLARSTKNALEIISDLFHRNINVHVLNMGLIENTPTGKLIFTIFSAFAEFERDLIYERTQEGKNQAKLKNGYKEGRPNKYRKEQLELALKLLEQDTYSEVEKKTGISRSTLYRTKKTYSDN